MTAQVFLAHQLDELSKVYDVTLVANLSGQQEVHSWLPKEVHVVDIPIQRKISPFSDIDCYFKLKRLFKIEKFALVHSVSPKAGLLAMLAASRAKVPVRIHTFTGQVWVTKTGLKRTILKTLDRAIAKRTTVALVDSKSQQIFLVENDIVTDSSSKVLCDGSISGVDCERFKPNPQARLDVRKQLGSDNSSVVVLFVGRLKKEKGVHELIEAFTQAKPVYANMELWLVGPDEEGVQQKVGPLDGVRYVSFTDEPQKYMASADVLCLPSYREGFGSVVIEAGACGIPSIGTDIYGLQDAIVDGETGILINPKSVGALAKAMLQLSQDESKRVQMGKAAQERAVDFFPQVRLTDAILTMYSELLGSPKT